MFRLKKYSTSYIYIYIYVGLIILINLCDEFFLIFDCDRDFWIIIISWVIYYSCGIHEQILQEFHLPLSLVTIYRFIALWNNYIAILNIDSNTFDITVNGIRIASTALSAARNSSLKKMKKLEFLKKLSYNYLINEKYRYTSPTKWEIRERARSPQKRK